MPPQGNTVLRTIADELLELVKKSKKISVEEAAKNLKIPVSTAQSLVDFLVEEKVFGIEYKFTTPYIYLYKEEVTEPRGRGYSFAKELITKEQFYEMAKKKNLPHELIEELWRKYIQQNIGRIKEEFFRKSKERGLQEGKLKEIWNKYLTYL